MYLLNKYSIQQTVLLLLLLLPVGFLLSTPSWANTPESYRVKRVVIDPGHGGKDYGAIGKRGSEKEINLAIALKLGKYIRENMPDVEVLFTRNEDVFVPLDQRSRFANENGADLFISIHCNANPSKTPYGTETYVMGQHKSQENLEVAMRENAVITLEEDYTTRYEGYDPNSAESFILFNLMQSSFEGLSLGMAALVQDEFRERAQRKDRGVKQAGFLVLWRVTMPSVLIEVGFISNPREEEYLLSESGQEYLASAIFRAFREYKKDVESRSSFTAQTQFDQVITQSQVPNNAAITSKWSESGSLADTPNSGVVFKVQVAASSRQIPLNSPSFRALSGVHEHFADGIYRYLVGSNRKYDETVELCSRIRQTFPDAFIVAFNNGLQIPVYQAIKLSSN